MVRLGFYTPFLATLGGGEKYLLSMLQVATTLPGSDVVLLSPERPTDADLRRLDVPLGVADFDWCSALDRRATRLSRRLDVFVAMQNVLPPRARAARSLAVVQFPFQTGRSRLLEPLTTVRKRLRLPSYDVFLCYSAFVAEHLRARLGVADPVVLEPPVKLPALPPPQAKDRVVLGVGRFFTGEHSKRHDVLIAAFGQLLERLGPGSGWELHLAGGSRDDAPARRYLSSLRSMAEGLPVSFHVNAERATIEDLYRRAALFWHATGFGVSPMQHPERLEHFGIATVEAMAHRCVPLAVARGGQLEVVADDETGVLWEDVGTLVERSVELIADPSRRDAMAARAAAAAARYSSNRFAERVRGLLVPAGA